jgi:SRSO17 transposase
MRQFISEGSWDDTALLHRHWQEVDRDLGEGDGVLILDGSDFPKQGFDSVGAKRQYCGQLGSGRMVKPACSWAMPAAPQVQVLLLGVPPASV